jgi:hypothetical protein
MIDKKLDDSIRKRHQWAHPGYRGRGIRIYYMMAGSQPYVCSDIAVKRTKKVVRLLDGGWLDPKDCFFTAEQCRMFNGQWFNDAIGKAKDVIEKAQAELIEAQARLDGMARSLEEAQAS